MTKLFITTDGTRVQTIHYMPFDPQCGLGKTEEELLREGFLVDSIPEPTQKDGMIAQMHYSPEKGFWYKHLPEPKKQMPLEHAVQSGIITKKQYAQLSGKEWTET